MVSMLNQCLKCFHEWTQRRKIRPEECPKCRTTDWDDSKPTRNSYTFNEIEIGETRIYNWHIAASGYPDEKKNIQLVRAVISYGHNTHKVFKREATPQGLKITRMS